MANTMVKIQTVTVGVSGAASMDFTNIPQTFTDLKLVVSHRDAYAGAFDSAKITFNNSTSGYSYRYVYGTGSAAASGNGTGSEGFVATGNGNASTVSTFGNVEVYIPDYTSSNYKSFTSEGVAEDNAGTAYQYLFAQLWSNTAAITSIKLTPYQPVNFVQYSSATLYGIKKA